MSVGANKYVASVWIESLHVEAYSGFVDRFEHIGGGVVEHYALSVGGCIDATIARFAKRTYG